MYVCMSFINTYQTHMLYIIENKITKMQMNKKKKHMQLGDEQIRHINRDLIH